MKIDLEVNGDITGYKQDIKLILISKIVTWFIFLTVYTIIKSFIGSRCSKFNR